MAACPCSDYVVLQGRLHGSLLPLSHALMTLHDRRSHSPDEKRGFPQVKHKLSVSQLGHSEVNKAIEFTQFMYSIEETVIKNSRCICRVKSSLVATRQSLGIRNRFDVRLS